MPTDTQIEAEIQAKGKTADRVTPADLQDNIVSEVYFTGSDGLKGGLNSPTGRVKSLYIEGVRLLAPLDTLTFCVLVLRNGFTVTGESACASPENFDSEIGRKIARQKAEQKIWPWLGYALKQKLHDASA